MRSPTTPQVTPATRRDRALVLGCEIDRLGMDETVRRCVSLIEGARASRQVSVNAAKVLLLRGEPRLRELFSESALVNADGQAVVWASRMLGDPLPERVAGIDLMARLIEVAEHRGYGIFILGARPEVLSLAVENLRRLHPQLRVVGTHHGYFSEEETQSVCDMIRAARPQILFVAMSSPRKEYWLADNAAHHGVPFAMGVGGAIDVIAGVTRRAPRWMQRTGLEWSYRLVQEPKRLLGRYASTNARFVALVVAELLGRAAKAGGSRVRVGL